MAFVWSADRLLDSKVDPQGNPPDADSLRRMIDELHTEWVPSDAPLDSLHEWSCERFGTRLVDISRETLSKGTELRIKQLTNLFELVKANSDLQDDPEAFDKVERIAKIMRETRNSLQATAILYYHIDGDRSYSIPEEWSPASYFTFSEDEKLTNFQKLVIGVLKRLSADKFRRLDDWVYEEVVIKETGERSHAWRAVMPLKDYIYRKIQKETDYEDWKCLTNPPDNGDKVVTHLCSSFQQEFPIVDMNRYIWAYNNGLYNVEEDMFWPFQSGKISRLCHVTKDRVRALKESDGAEVSDEMDPASPDTVQDGVCVWNIAEGELLDAKTCFCLDNRYYSNFAGREAWPTMAYDITTFRRGLCIGDMDHVSELSVAALSPIIVAEHETMPDEADAVKAGQVSVWNVEDDGSLSTSTVFGLQGSYYSNYQSHVHFAHMSEVSRVAFDRIRQLPLHAATPPGSTVAVDDIRVYLGNDDGTLAANAVLEVDGQYYSNRNVRIWTKPNGEPYVARAPTQRDVAVKHFDLDFRFKITPETEEAFDPEDVALPDMERIMTTQQLDADSQSSSSTSSKVRKRLTDMFSMARALNTLQHVNTL